jgi:uncharacterized protein
MRHRIRLVVDTNVLVSAFLWRGTPGQLIELAGEREIQLVTSRVLIEELADTLSKKKLAKAAALTGLTVDQMVRHYRRLTTMVPSARLAQQVSRDADDDAVLACAAAARAHLIVSGDQDLLVLKSFEGIPVVTAAEALQIIHSNN